MNTENMRKYFEPDGSPKILAEAPGGEGCAVAPGSAVFDPGVLARSMLPDELAERFRREGIKSIVNDRETGGSVVCYWLAGRVMIDAVRLPGGLKPKVLPFNPWR